ncbi:MAG: hypothetical protein KUG78_15635 [Kangiellaceae bacterium]|nr:hypothetical protein [Kangiellaceae bacterium]
MQVQKRTGGKTPVSSYRRTDRIVKGDQGYHFKTREESLMGPFPTEAEARYELNVFIKIKQVEKEFGIFDASQIA